MPRTTVDIDAPVLKDLKRLQRREGKSLGRLISELLTEALAQHRPDATMSRRRLQWVARPMNARIDLADKEAVHAALDRDRPSPPRSRG